MAKTVLVINSGSSSIKYQLVDLESGEGLASGLVEKIGEPVDGHYKHEYNGEKHELEEPIHDHEQGLRRVLGFFKEYGPDLSEAGIVAVGHRVVQGGSLFPKPALVTDKTINAVKDLAVLAPLHNGPEAKGAEVMRALLPDVPQIFVFDSSFFFQLPKAASTYALNKEIADQYPSAVTAPTAPRTSSSPPWSPASSASRPKASSRSCCTSATEPPPPPRFPASRSKPPWV